MPLAIMPVGLVISIAVLVFAAAFKKIHPFFALIAAAIIFSLFSGMNPDQVFTAFFDGLGDTVASVGLIIAIGTITGMLLQNCGGAEAMARAILKRTGTRNADLGMALTGYFVSLAVFCDAAYVILAPLARKLSALSQTSMATMALSLSFAMLTTNQLIPPTAGPMAAAGVLGVDMGMAIMLSMLVSIPVIAMSCFLARRFGRDSRYEYFVDEDTLSLLSDENASGPSATEAFLPILLPLALMMTKTFYGMLMPTEGVVWEGLTILGQPAVALLIGLLLAVRTYRRVKPEDKQVATYDGVFGDALKTAGQITLIVAVGGGFGGLLKASPLQDVMTSLLAGFNIGLLAPFIIGVVLRTAIGSASITLLTGASMIGPMLGVLGLGSPEGAIIAMLALGAGASMIVHGNDNYFWMVSSCSGMKTETAFKLIPKTSVILSLTALAATWLLKLVLI
ncbi:GntP family permease [Kistimonas asteriae]|uniref:GntP family permease n=1 Tax=Kistimonas asteriae TaxID=517724 RepID=UPI001BA9F477|nr:GntP family permease [Kistimonas asteriae]